MAPASRRGWRRAGVRRRDVEELDGELNVILTCLATLAAACGSQCSGTVRPCPAILDEDLRVEVGR